MGFGVKFLRLKIISYVEETLVLSNDKTSQVYSFGLYSIYLLTSDFQNIISYLRLSQCSMHACCHLCT